MAQYSKYVMPVVIVAVFVLSILIIKPFIVALITSAIIAYTFHPIYRWLRKYIKNETAAALIVSSIILLLIGIPIAMIVNTISREALVLYLQGKQFFFGGLGIDQCRSVICETIRDWSSDESVRFYIQEVLSDATTYLRVSASNFIVALPQRALEMFITFFATFYLIRDGEKLNAMVRHLITTNKSKRQHIFKRFNEVMHSVIFGSLFIAFIQGLTGGIGFAVFGISSPITWGVAMFFLALVPYIGTGLIWVPASLGLIIKGIAETNNSIIVRGIMLFFYGLLVISSIDNIIKPKIIGQHSRVHPVLVLVGIFGGLSLIGIPGIVVGPVILAMALTFLELYVHHHQKVQ